MITPLIASDLGGQLPRLYDGLHDFLDLQSNTLRGKVSGSVCGCGVYVQEWKWGVKLLKNLVQCIKTLKKYPFSLIHKLEILFWTEKEIKLWDRTPPPAHQLGSL